MLHVQSQSLEVAAHIPLLGERKTSHISVMGDMIKCFHKLCHYAEFQIPGTLWVICLNQMWLLLLFGWFGLVACFFFFFFVTDLNIV